MRMRESNGPLPTLSQMAPGYNLCRVRRIPKVCSRAERMIAATTKTGSKLDFAVCGLETDVPVVRHHPLTVQEQFPVPPHRRHLSPCRSSGSEQPPHRDRESCLALEPETELLL